MCTIKSIPATGYFSENVCNKNSKKILNAKRKSFVHFYFNTFTILSQNCRPPHNISTGTNEILSWRTKKKVEKHISMQEQNVSSYTLFFLSESVWMKRRHNLFSIQKKSLRCVLPSQWQCYFYINNFFASVYRELYIRECLYM